ncbi:MAG TPA: primosomal protein N' [Anaerohalosphaeraceae bacterium]|nr:primosomal protein N' [Anaerohalosphaeraceae bacterium]HOL89796.1 primosomal protein N' [Anaerohalosphaeraceae bacterium]HPP57275.1 primosomal protein N' [Anaerohalosphaeraceae bacterium]
MGRRTIDSLFGSEPTKPADGRVIRAAFNTGADALFDYLLPSGLGPVRPGQRVRVPFGRTNRLLEAFVVEVEPADAGADSEWQKARGFDLKTVREILDEEPLLDEQLMELARWMSAYYVCPLGQVLAAMVPAAVKKEAGVRKEVRVYLTGEQPADSKLGSGPQRALVRILQGAGAVSEETAIEKTTLLERAGCTEGPLKKLLRSGAAACAVRYGVRPLPIVPEGLREQAEAIVLTEDQQRALTHLEQQLQAGQFAVTLLHGVTDSGKTEVYIRAIEKAVSLGRQAIVMLPEIALTAQTVQRFGARFQRLAVMHSGLSGPQRNAQWQAIRRGQADVVIGARSAVFAPLQRLGLIVVDEEHEASYKQDMVPRYHGRDAAIKRAQLAGAVCLLGSATPSLETLHNCQTRSSYTRIVMARRVRNLPMPKMDVINMLTAFEGRAVRQPQLLSPALEEALHEVLQRGEQAILLLNRRGYSHFIYCPSCRHTLHCRNCDVTLTYHKRPHREGTAETVLGPHMTGGYAICHYCLAKTLVPKACPLCGQAMTMIGLGAQRLEEEVQHKLPQARLRRIDSDAMAGRDYYGLLEDFAAGRIDILVGTQMLAKGLHFPNVTLVGIVSADTALLLPDFRANERTFQLICQAAGRAGRSEKGGRVLIQTFLPGQPAIDFACRYDWEGFVQEEMKHRRACHLPPVWRMAMVLMRDGRYERLTAAAKAVNARLEQIIEREKLPILLRGPMEAPISRIGGQHRMHLIVQARQPQTIQHLFARFRAAAPVRPAVQIQIDIDPVCVL